MTRDPPLWFEVCGCQAVIVLSRVAKRLALDWRAAVATTVRTQAGQIAGRCSMT
ncbi:hypothetical protein Mnod_6300 [Methylobacterium nodulans ORS 2060]|uniref:Uncharacterized protein n=1 Tax=Methylobacterium nodulans (strain LMG 21967 / CNCM I-2342 / ORS 2060) TaxID=460265 RepID=B8IAQ9_METNO|nr:hypothetical protein Mnod_6300 [Methylobacterium nodulans ORS 2060]